MFLWWVCRGCVQPALFGTWECLSLLACPSLFWGCSLNCIFLIIVLIVSMSSRRVSLAVTFLPPVLSVPLFPLVVYSSTLSISSAQHSFSGLVSSCVGLSVPVLLGPFFLPLFSPLLGQPPVGCGWRGVGEGVVWCCLRRCVLCCSYVLAGGSRLAGAWAAACTT